MDLSLPKAFDATDESNKIVAKAKQSLTKKFSWKKRDVLYDAVDLAVTLIALERNDEALEVCQFLGQFQFAQAFPAGDHPRPDLNLAQAHAVQGGAEALNPLAHPFLVGFDHVRHADNTD